MLSELELSVLAAFFPNASGRTIKDLQASGYSYERVYTVLKELAARQTVKENHVGKTLTYDLNAKSEDALLGFMHYATGSKSRFKDKNSKALAAVEELSRLVNNDMTLIFGSYAKGTQGAESDVDVLVISSDKGIDGQALALRHKYGLRLNAVAVERAKFRQIKQDNPEFYSDIVEHGVIVKGYELFFELVYR